MPTPILYAENVLAGAIFTLSPDGAVEGKDVDRLDDLDIGLECEDSGTSGLRTFHADRGVGASAPTVAAAIFSGSHYAGESLTIETSADNSSWTPRATIVPADDTPQRVVFDGTGGNSAPFTMPRYARWHATDPALPLIFTEFSLSPAIELADKPISTRTREPYIPNVSLTPSLSGRDFGVQHGARKWSATYPLIHASDDDLDTVLEVLDAILDGARPFWLRTVRGALKWCRLLTPTLEFERQPGKPSTWIIPLTFREEL